MKIQVLHTGEVCVSPYLPLGGDVNLLKAAGLTTRWKDRLWLPVSCYLIETEHGRILFDTGWARSMSPKGKYDVPAQIKSLGSVPLFFVNQGKVGPGETIGDQLKAMGLAPSDIDYVLLSHLDCDHANGLSEVKGAKNFLCADAELKFAGKGGSNKIRYYSKWWKDIPLTTFDWNGTEGPVGRSYDVFGDGQVVMVNIPGHADGLCALKLTNSDGKFVLLFADGGYAVKSWKEQILPGISSDRDLQKKSLAWIREQSLDPNCVESLANHDPDVVPHTIEL